MDLTPILGTGPFTTRSTPLAAALWTCNYPLKIKPVIDTASNTRRAVYFFDAVDRPHPYPVPCNLSVRAAAGRFEKPDYRSANPRDPMSWMQRVLEARLEFSAAIKTLAFSSSLPSMPAGVFTTRNTLEAASLRGAGFQLLRDCPMTIISGVRGKPAGFFHFAAGAPHPDIAFPGSMGTAAGFIALWNDWDFLNANPDHPITYSRFVLENRERLLDIVNREKPMTWREIGNRCYLIGSEMDDRTKELMIASAEN